MVDAYTLRSLEGIFLSAFVLIGQNRQATFKQAKADHDFNEQELEAPGVEQYALPCDARAANAKS